MGTEVMLFKAEAWLLKKPWPLGGKNLQVFAKQRNVALLMAQSRRLGRE